MTRVDVLAEKGTEEVLSEGFYALCKEGTWIEDHGEEITIKCYPVHMEQFLAHLCSAGLRIRHITVVEEEEKDYARLVREHFTPVVLGPVTIIPPWRTRKRKGITIIIEPGMAFGTGRHESTKLMLKMMTSLDLKDKSVLDLGSGSGILAIYASLLGAARVAAIDHDPLATAAAKKGCNLNNVTNVLVACADLACARGTFDLVLANLDYRTFSIHAEEIADRVREGGYLLISGIEKQFKGAVLSLFAAFPLVEQRSMKGWHAFLFKIDRKRRNK